MDTLECIKTRRTIRKFTEQPIEFDKIAQIMEAGAHAPSSGNIQNYRFILVTEKSLIHKLYEHCLKQEALYHAQVAVIIIGEDDKAERMYGLRGRRLYSVQNCACAAENMLLAAHALGLGGCWIGAFDEDKVGNMFNVEEHARAQAILALGYPDEKPEIRKKDLASFVHFNNYATKVKDVPVMLRDFSVKIEHGVREAHHKGEKGFHKIKKAIKDWHKKKLQKSGKTVMVDKENKEDKK